MVNQARRTEIVDAALVLFDQRGYWGTGMEDIARLIGMRASSLYNHCSGKQELLGEICVTGMQELIAAHDEAMGALASPHDRLVAAMDCHVHFHATHAPAVRVSNREVNSLQEPWAEQVRQLRRDYVKRWVRIIEDGIAGGEFQSDDPKISSYFLIDMATGVSAWFRPDGRYTLDELAQQYSADALRMLAARPLPRS